MRKIVLVRHAESKANEGKFFLNKEFIPLSEKGLKNSIIFSEKINEPQSIIFSKYLRTKETATPIILKFPNTKTFLWNNLHEFDYINPSNLSGLSSKEREKKEFEYWKKLDPFTRDDFNRENFKDFVNRIIIIINKIKKIKFKTAYIFTHGHVIRLIMILLDEYSDYKIVRKDKDFYKKIMKSFYISLYKKKTKINNLFQFEISNHI